MTRKTSTALLLAACALAACTHSSSTGSAPARGPRPNVLLVVTDDQTVNEMAVMAHARRWLSRGGVTFDHAFVTTPQCCPSRASILSGRFAHNTGVKDNFDAAKLNHATTVEHLLRSSGYETAIFGKFLNSWDMRRDPPFFDRWAITSHSGRGYRDGRWNVQGQMRTVHAYNTDFLFRKTRRFISSADTPWFAYLATAAPHAPFRAAPRYARRPVPRWRPNPAVRERHRSDKPGFVRGQHPEMRR